ncbi:transketolase, partial [Clostridiales bacterium F-3ap]|nr:transketolase [Anaerotalea alkaliphila]
MEKDLISTVRVLSAEGVEKACSGHPGLPLGAAPMACTLWAGEMKHNPRNPSWFDRDRFILSAGHGSMLLYSLLHLFGYGVDMEDLQNFRQTGSKTPGHPEYGHTPGVEMTTGPLGQGFASAVGMALAEAYLAKRFNKEGLALVDHHTYVLAGDGCMMEGVSSEAASLAGTLGLGKLVVLYDSNGITIEGTTDTAFREDVSKRFEAYGWQTLEVEDGEDTEAIRQAIRRAKADTARPSLVKVNTRIGAGCPPKEGKASAHGEPLGEENIRLLKENLDHTGAPFTVSPKVREGMRFLTEGLAREEARWNGLLERYRQAHPEDAAAFGRWLEKADSLGLDRELEGACPAGAQATRVSSHGVLNRLAEKVPNLIGGAAD